MFHEIDDTTIFHTVCFQYVWYLWIWGFHDWKTTIASSIFELILGVFWPLREHPEIADSSGVRHAKRHPKRDAERKQRGRYMLNAGLFTLGVPWPIGRSSGFSRKLRIDVWREIEKESGRGRYMLNGGVCACTDAKSERERDRDTEIEGERRERDEREKA